MTLMRQSNCDDGNFAAGGSHESLYIFEVAGEYRGFALDGGDHHRRVNDVRRFGPAEQPSGFVRFRLAERNNHAPRQEAPELGLLGGPADLGDHRRGNEGHYAEFQTDLMVGPRSPLVPIGRDQYGRVVDHCVHAERRTGCDG